VKSAVLLIVSMCLAFGVWMQQDRQRRARRQQTGETAPTGWTARTWLWLAGVVVVIAALFTLQQH
jgi:ABC-type Fe3+ transport system permease subunit